MITLSSGGVLVGLAIASMCLTGCDEAFGAAGRSATQNRAPAMPKAELTPELPKGIESPSAPAPTPAPPVEPVELHKTSQWLPSLMKEVLVDADRSQLEDYLAGRDTGTAGKVDASAASVALVGLPTRVLQILDQGIHHVDEKSAHRDFLFAVRHVGAECIGLMDKAGTAAAEECDRIRKEDYRELSEREHKLRAGLSNAEGKDEELLRNLIKRTQDQLGALSDRAELLDRQKQSLTDASAHVRRMIDTCARAEAFVPTNSADCGLLRDSLVELLTERGRVR